MNTQAITIKAIAKVFQHQRFISVGRNSKDFPKTIEAVCDWLVCQKVVADASPAKFADLAILWRPEFPQSLEVCVGATLGLQPGFESTLNISEGAIGAAFVDDLKKYLPSS